jgi:hypothetical protein
VTNLTFSIGTRSNFTKAEKDCSTVSTSCTEGKVWAPDVRRCSHP